MKRPKTKALLIAGVILVSLAVGGCQKEKIPTEELLLGYQYTLKQLADILLPS